jgi:hypothetical protein
MKKIGSIIVKQIENIKTMNKYRLASFIFVIIFACVLIFMARNQPIHGGLGETWLYVMATAALQYEHSIHLTETTLSNLYEHFRDFHGAAAFYYSIGRLPIIDGIAFSHYFPAYSLSCIPASIALEILGFNQSWAFAMTNIGLILMALLCMLIFLKESDKIKFFLLLVLAINPVILYVHWASAEVFMWAFIVMSMVFYYNKAYKRAAFFLTVAGSMNMTLMVLGFFMIASYFIDLQKEKGVDKNFFKTVFKNFFDVLKYAASFSFIFLVFPYNYAASGGASALATMVGEGGIPWESYGSTMGQRFVAYLFDLNFGMLPWFFLLCLVYPVCLVYSFRRKEYQYYLPALAFFPVAFLFSGMAHINSGMTGISRYNAWAAPIMLFPCVLSFFKLVCSNDRDDFSSERNEFSSKKVSVINRVKISIISISVVLTGLLVYDNNHDIAYGYRSMLTPARIVLNTAPALYNPLFPTFVSRVEHVDGGYNYSQPVIYENRSGEIRKMLVTPNTAHVLNEMIDGDAKSLEWLDTKITEAELREGFQYIDICPFIDVSLYRVKPTEFKLPDMSAAVRGVHAHEVSHIGDYVWLTPRAVLRLQVGDKPEEGLRFDFYVSEILAFANPGKDLRIRIFIDNKLTETIEINSIGPLQVFVDGSMLPNKEYREQYEIRIDVNGSFVPFNLPPPYFNHDYRELSIILQYIG